MSLIGVSGRFLRKFASAIATLSLALPANQAIAGSVMLAWDPVANASLAGYVLHYGASAGNYTSKIDVGNKTTWTATNLTDGATYHFVVTAYDGSRAESGFSNDVGVTIPYAAPVANFTASTTSGTAPLALNFTSTSTGNITGYKWTFGDGTASTAAGPSHVYSTAGTYTVGLTVSGPGGTSTKTASNYIKVTATGDTTPPNAPASLAASTGTAGVINLRWTASTDNVGVTGYTIERCKGSGCTAFAQIGTSSATSFGDAGLAAGTVYAYRVRAADVAGNVSAYSNVASASAGSTTPTATSTALTATPNPAVAGSVVTFNAVVTGNSPTGTVQFLADGTTIGGCATVTLASGRATCATSALVAGTHAIVAKYSGNSTNAASTSVTWTQVVSAPIDGTDVALAMNGGVASASSVWGPSFAPSGVIDNKRSGAGWGNYAGWADGTSGTFPDWVQINFGGSRSIDHVVVYSVQDNYLNPVEPTDTMTGTRFVLTSFQVQGWNGSGWVTLASVSGNNLIKRTVSFSAYTTDRVRILVTGTQDGVWSRITEVEAWTSTVVRTDYALALNGASATASSRWGPSFAAWTVIDNKRSGANWGNYAGWADGTSGVFPDWLQVNFNGAKVIDRVVVYSVQDNYLSPVEPTDSMTGTRFVVAAFDVQVWNGGGWTTVASVAGNTLIKRTVSFTPYVTSAMRVVINGTEDGVWSRLTEVEAWGR